MWGEIKHQLGAWTEEGYDGRAGNAAYIAYIKFRTRPTRWDLSSASTVLSQQPQTSIWILNYDTLEPPHNAEVGNMAGCYRNMVLYWQRRIAGLSNVQGHLCFAVFWFPLFFPNFYFFHIFLFLLPLFSHMFAFSCFSSFFPCCFNPNTVPPSPQARVGLLLEIGCSLSLQRAMLKLQPGPARSLHYLPNNRASLEFGMSLQCWWSIQWKIWIKQWILL